MRLAAAALVGLLAACTGTDTEPPATTSTTTTTTPVTVTVTTSTAPPTTAPVFTGEITAVDPARLAASWRPGCPIPVEELRLLTIDHWGFDGAVHRGELVVHEQHADSVLGVFRSLFDAHFPLEQVRLVDEFDGDDDRSMAANNTSAFNCRAATGSSRWSEHAYGRAIDLNPIQNPYVTASGRVLPPEGSAFAVRDDRPGVILADGPVVAAFASIGWEWGGHWSSGKDYQHFSATGR